MPDVPSGGALIQVRAGGICGSDLTRQRWSAPLAVDKIKRLI